MVVNARTRAISSWCAEGSSASFRRRRRDGQQLSISLCLAIAKAALSRWLLVLCCLAGHHDPAAAANLASPHPWPQLLRLMLRTPRRVFPRATLSIAATTLWRR